MLFNLDKCAVMHFRFNNIGRVWSWVKSYLCEVVRIQVRGILESLFRVI